MNSIDQSVSECMSANEDNFFQGKFQARKNPLVGSGLLGRPDLHRILNRSELIMTVNGMSVQKERKCQGAICR